MTSISLRICVWLDGPKTWHLCGDVMLSVSSVLYMSYELEASELHLVTYLN